MVEKSQSERSEESKKKELDSVKKETEEKSNKGKLILDATCAPADITYPHDLGLLNQARMKTEKIVDILYKPLKGQIPEFGVQCSEFGVCAQRRLRQRFSVFSLDFYRTFNS